MKENFITIKDVALKNNCPECYSNSGLHLTYKQQFIETNFYKSLTKETTHQITCKTCDTIIYPVSWTDDIERVFNYHQRAFVPKKASFKLKRHAWILIGIGILMLVAGVVLLLLKPSL